jgi:hypothetical protein
MKLILKSKLHLGLKEALAYIISVRYLAVFDHQKEISKDNYQEKGKLFYYCPSTEGGLVLNQVNNAVN